MEACILSEKKDLDKMLEEENREEENYFPSLDKKRSYFSWSMYDWANSVFATTVMAGFFPTFLKYYALVGTSYDSTVVLGFGTSIAALIVAAIGPVLGSISDKMAGKKKFLVFFAYMGIILTGSLFLVQEGMWIAAILLYGIANIGFAGANVFYNSLLPGVASQKKIDYVSSLGYSLGYIGGAILFTINIVMVLIISDTYFAIKLSFITAAIWWAAFTIPLILYVKEPPVKAEMTVKKAVKSGWQQLKSTFADIRALKIVGLFLVAYWLYVDGVNTIIAMAVNYGENVFFPSKNISTTQIVIYLMIALLITNIIGFPATLLYDKFAKKIGVKNSILVAIGVYIVIVVFAYFMTAIWEFFVLAVAVGFVQGGIQALSRSLYSRLIPRKKAGEFYGFFNMIGKFAAILGPALMAFVKLFTSDMRLSILSILVLFVAGGILLLFVNMKKGEEMALKYLA